MHTDALSLPGGTAHEQMRCGGKVEVNDVSG